MRALHKCMGTAAAREWCGWGHYSGEHGGRSSRWRHSSNKMGLSAGSMAEGAQTGNGLGQRGREKGGEHLQVGSKTGEAGTVNKDAHAQALQSSRCVAFLVADWPGGCCSTAWPAGKAKGGPGMRWQSLRWQKGKKTACRNTMGGRGARPARAGPRKPEEGGMHWVAPGDEFNDQE